MKSVASVPLLCHAICVSISVTLISLQIQNFLLSFPLDDASCTTVYFFFFSFAFYCNRIRHNMIAACFLAVYYYFACAYEESNDNTLDLKLGLAAASLLLLIKKAVINRLVLTTHLISEGLNLNLI